MASGSKSGFVFQLQKGYASVTVSFKLLSWERGRS